MFINVKKVVKYDYVQVIFFSWETKTQFIYIFYTTTSAFTVNTGLKGNFCTYIFM